MLARVSIETGKLRKRLDHGRNLTSARRRLPMIERISIDQDKLRARLNTYTTRELDLMEELAQAEARNNFWKFRQRINPKMHLGWWQREVAYELQKFYEDLIAGKRPYLVLMAPPQHGKTKQVTDFLAWVAGKNPNWKSMFSSYSDDLGTGVNLSLQRIFDSDVYKSTFPETRISETNVVTGLGRYMRNSSLLEYVGKIGSFRNTTVGGQINGLGFDLGVIDDPIKGRKEAQSKLNRDNAWLWLTDDFFGRFADAAGMLMIMTRWHLDDPMGRFIERFPNTRVLRYAALARKDERHRKKGEPLFPEHKSKVFLLERKKLLTKAGWESLYQQHPIIAGGDLFPIENIKIVNHAPDPKQIISSVRYWDKAGTEGGGAYTSGVLMHHMKDGRFFVEDCERGQWNAFNREVKIKQVSKTDQARYPHIVIWVEQEPGSGGKESAERTIARLAGFNVRADKVTGPKEIRAEVWASQVQGNTAMMMAGPWNRDFLEEHETFPSGKYKDTVDAASGACMKLAEEDMSYDETLAWVG